MNPAKKLLLLLSATAAASVIHYVDNIARWALYPEPAWDNARITDGFWFLMTPVGIAAYVLYRRGKVWPAILASYLYGVMNLVVLGHYLFAWPWEISPVVNGTILVESVMAAWLIGYTLSLHLRLPPQELHAA
jgi:hypothetical protein